MARIHTKRIYGSPSKSDGFRILVDGLWPRGLHKDKAPIDFWLKEIAPSAELRKWFGHESGRWAEFRRRYFRELDAMPAVVARLRAQAAERDIVLVYAARDEQHNNAVCLKQYLERGAVSADGARTERGRGQSPVARCNGSISRGRTIG